MRGALVRIGAPQNVLDDMSYFLYKTASTKDSWGSRAGVPSMIYRFGDYEFDAQRCELRCAGQLDVHFVNPVPVGFGRDKA